VVGSEVKTLESRARIANYGCGLVDHSKRPVQPNLRPGGQATRDGVRIRVAQEQRRLELSMRNGLMSTAILLRHDRSG